MKVWDVESGRELRSIESNGGVIHRVALSADGRRAMTVCDYGSISAWDLDTGVALWTTQAQPRQMYSVALSPDGALVAAGGSDGVVRVVNAADGSQYLALSGHSESVYDLAWTLDGTRLISASVDRTLQIYAIDIDLLLSLARTRVTRNLTADECKRYLHCDDVPPVP
jgi:WD40 repeat protein